MARIQKRKGYPSVFKVAEYIRAEGLKAKITFYGQISKEDEEDFLDSIESNKDIVKYGGVLSPNEISKTLSQYDVMLLPTTYYTEGFPGSILDAYISGIPVIVTEWKHSHEFVKDGETGFIVPFKNGQDLLNERIKLLCFNRKKLKEMKVNARKKCNNYSEDMAWEILKKHLN